MLISYGGKTITWTVGATLFRQPLSTVSFEPEKPPEPAAAAEKKDATEPAKQEPKKSLAEEIELIVEKPRHTPKGNIVLRGAKVITMRGDETITDADVVVTDNRIVAVGRRGTVTVPADARIFDVKGKVIMPGLVDIHAHWEVRHQVLDTEDYTFWANLAYGVTTGRDPQTNTNDTFAYTDLVDIGEMIGPRAFSTGPGVFADTDFQSAEEAKNTVARYRKHYKTNTLKSYLVGNRQQRQWVVEACKELQVLPTTEGGADFKMNLTHAIDGFSGNEHALPIVPLYNDVVQLFAKTGITYTPTLLVAYGGPIGEYHFFETTEVYDDPKLQRFTPQSVLYGKTARLLLAEVIVAATVCPNIYLELSSLMPHHIAEVLQHVPSTRLMVGSDLPESLTTELSKIFFMNLSPAVTRDLLWNTAAALLG